MSLWIRYWPAPDVPCTHVDVDIRVQVGDQCFAFCCVGGLHFLFCFFVWFCFAGSAQCAVALVALRAVSAHSHVEHREQRCGVRQADTVFRWVDGRCSALCLGGLHFCFCIFGLAGSARVRLNDESAEQTLASCG